MTRPPLPTRYANPHISATLNSGVLPPVKYQILTCQGQDILVGRLKIETPTPSGHAFILRRFDTGAVSLTTMFRAAFPNAADHEEKNEVQWVKDHYDLSGNNGSTKDNHITRLAGTWVSPQVALELGKMYALGAIITAVVEATPDPNGNYRRSGKAAASAPKPLAAAPSAQAPTKSLPTPSPKAALPNPAKRRKESSPAPLPPPTPIATPSSPKLPRRSTRTKSPAPRSATLVAPLSPVVVKSKPSPSPKVPKTIRRDIALTPQGSDETAVEEESESVMDVAGSDLRQQDLLEQKELIEDLKAQRDAAMTVGGSEDMDVDGAAKLKRAREEEEEQLQFDFKEPENEERAIATNRRVSRFHLEPRAKSFAWGVAAFAFGMGAVSFLPSFF